MTKREFLKAGFGTGLALAQATGQSERRVQSRRAKTTKLFKSPPGFPNGVAVTAEGLWIGEQKLSGAQAAAYRLPEPENLMEAAWLVDRNGKVLKTVTTPSRNTSGMAVGGGYVWMVANARPRASFKWT